MSKYISISKDKILKQYIKLYSTSHIYLHAKYLGGLAEGAEAQLALALFAQAKMPAGQQEHARLA